MWRVITWRTSICVRFWWHYYGSITINAACNRIVFMSPWFRNFIDLQMTNFGHTNSSYVLYKDVQRPQHCIAEYRIAEQKRIFRVVQKHAASRIECAQAQTQEARTHIFVAVRAILPNVYLMFRLLLLLYSSHPKKPIPCTSTRWLLITHIASTRKHERIYILNIMLAATPHATQHKTL